MNLEKCYACGACLSACNQNAISFIENEAGFIYPVTDETKCIHCNKCSDVCPIDKDTNTSLNYSWKLKGPENIRTSSSSGGAFQLLAKKTIENNGIVFGAGFDSQMNLKIISADCVNKLSAITQSKYIQANPEMVFIKVKQSLETQKEVLFCSTPCMIHGLKLFLGKDTENLKTADLVCKGVPSSGFWNRYLDYLAHLFGQKPSSFLFRDKKYSTYGRTVSFECGGKDYHEHHIDNPWMRLYQRNITLRECCMHCNYDANHSVADLTLGDFWNNNECEDGLGVSLVVSHSKKGNTMIEQITADCSCVEVTEYDYQKTDRCCSPAITMMRKLFINEFKRCHVNCCDIEMLFKKYGA